MTTITLPRAVAEQALEALEYAQQGRECPSTTRQAITALRAALAQQAEPVEPHRREGDNNIESPFNACMHKTYCMTLKQAEPLNLADPAVRKRLATQWGYVPAAQAEPVEPVAYTTGHCENHKQKGGCQLHNLQCGWPDCDRKPTTAPPQRAEPVEPVATLIAQRDALLEVLKYLDKEFRRHGRQHWPEAVRVGAAIRVRTP